MKRHVNTIMIILACSVSSMGYAANTASSTQSIPDKSATSADILGWTTGTAPNGFCEGYYVETPIDYPFTVAQDAKKSPIDIQADSTRYAQKGESLLQGNVTVTQPDKQLKTDKAYLIRDPKTGKINVVHALGDVRLREPGRLLQGTEATVTLDNKTWQMKNPTYRLVMDNHYKPHIVTNNQPYNVYDLSGWGNAREAYKGTDGTIIIHHGTFSTCSPEKAFWQFHASTIELDRKSGRGTSYNNILYMEDLPVFYMPYANFPIDNRRKTGFLFPTFSTSSTDGFDFALPFYWNIAPNYDATVTSHFNEHRGARFDGLFRYLIGSPNSTGTVSGIWLPNDRELAQFQRDAPSEYDTSIPENKDNLDTLEDANDTRTFIHLDNTTQWNTHLTSSVTYNHASDDYFSEDFATGASSVTNQQLLQQANVTYSDRHWQLIGNVEGYQTLHPIDQTAVANSYTRLPQLAVTGRYPDALAGVDFNVKSDFTNFAIEKNPGASTQPVNGLRYNVNPSVSVPWRWGEAAYIKPTAQLDMTTYQLNNSGALSQSPTVALPMFDIDAGLFFDRKTTVPLTKQTYTQTLEPRLFYLYVPYKDQSNVPIFDTGVSTFDASQLYATNRFTGLDRIGDANQVSFSLTSRLLEANSGNEKLSATIGEILYFENRRVQLCTDGSTDCNTLQPDARRTDGTSDTDTLSPIIGQLDYHLTNDFTTTAATAWSPESGKLTSSTLDLQYKPEPNRIINLGYSFLREGDIYPVSAGQAPLPLDDSRNNLNQIDFSFTWPIWGSWSALGRFNYNMSHEYAQDYFYGLQYDSCCWAVRVLGSRYFSNFDNQANAQFKQEYYLQFLFKGIGSVGTSDPSGLLSSGIRSYTDPFGRRIV